MYLVFTRMPGESYRRRLGSLLLYLCYVLRALINFLVFYLRFWRIPPACRNSTQSSHLLECICQCTVANTGWLPECSDGKRYKNSKCFHALRNRKQSLSHLSKQTCTCKRRSIFVFARRFVITRSDLALKLLLPFSPMLWTWSVSNVSCFTGHKDSCRWLWPFSWSKRRQAVETESFSF